MVQEKGQNVYSRLVYIMNLNFYRAVTVCNKRFILAGIRNPAAPPTK